MDNIEYQFTSIELSQNQAEFLAWTHKHYHQLIEIKNSKCLEIPGSNFTVHLKDSMNLDIPPLLDHIDKNQQYYPNRSY